MNPAPPVRSTLTISRVKHRICPRAPRTKASLVALLAVREQARASGLWMSPGRRGLLARHVSRIREDLNSPLPEHPYVSARQLEGLLRPSYESIFPLHFFCPSVRSSIVSSVSAPSTIPHRRQGLVDECTIGRPLRRQ